MANKKNDQSVLSHIDQLVKEEERLYAKTGLTDDNHARSADVKVELDQCWDLLRQRHGLREFGEDPDKAKVCPAKIVEYYERQFAVKMAGEMSSEAKMPQRPRLGANRVQPLG
jgi:Protein of unknown function (DUF2630)